MSPENLNTEPAENQNLSPEEIEAQAEKEKREEKVEAVTEYLAAFDKLETEFHAGGQTEDALGALEEVRDAKGAELDVFEGVDRRSASAKLKQLEGVMSAQDALDAAFHAGASEEELGKLEEQRDALRHDFGDGLDILMGARAKANKLIAAQDALDSAFHTGASEEELGALEEARDAAKHEYVEIGGDPDTPWGMEGSKDEYRFLAEVYVGESEAKAEYLEENPEVVEGIGHSTVELGDVLNDAEEQMDPASRWAADVASVDYDGARTTDEWKEAYPQGEWETDEEYYDRLNDMLLTEYVLADDGEKERRELNPTAREKYEDMVQRRLENGDLTQEEADRMLGLAQEHQDNADSQRAFEEAQNAELDSLVRRVNANDPNAMEFLEKHPELQDDILHRVAELNGRDYDEMMNGDQHTEGAGEDNTGDENTAEETTGAGDQMTAEETAGGATEETGEEDTGDETTADETTGEENPGGRVVEGDDQQQTPEEINLAGVVVDREKEARDAAHSIAEKLFAQKKSERKGIFRKLVLGVTDNLFREAKIKRYEAWAYDAIIAKQEGRANEISDQDWAANKAGIQRMLMAAMDEYGQEMIHRAAGENMDAYGVEQDENGNKIVYRYSRAEDGSERKERMDADSPEAKATIAMQDAVREYAGGRIDRATFEEQMARAKNSMYDDGAEKGLKVNNFSDLADEIDRQQAMAEIMWDRSDHEARMDNAIAGFRFINAETRSGVRSEAHRDALDRITNRLIEAKAKVPGLSWVPAEAIAVAASVATYVSQSTARTALRAIVPGVGGALAAGSLAAIRERNRVTGDRQTLARRLATGESAGSTGYDQAMEGAMYEMKPAAEYTSDLMAQIESVRESNGSDPARVDALMKQLALVETAVSMSDSRGIDLISYTNGNTETIEQERIALDLARAQAKTLIGRDVLASSPSYAAAVEVARETFEEDIDVKDRAFKSLRRRREAAQFTKSAVTSAVTMVASQEVVAAFSPDQYGVVDYLKGDVNPGTSKTLLANLFKLKPADTIDIQPIPGDEIMTTMAEGAKMTPEQAEAYRQQGYIVNSREIPGETREITVESSAAEYASEHGVPVHRVDWGSNGTKFSDGNELRVYYGNNGTGDTFVSGMYGASTTWGGETINYAEAAADGKIRMLLTLSQDTQAKPIELVGALNDRGQLEFSAPNEEIRQIIADRSFRFAEVVYDRGLNADGIREDIIPLATAVGPGLSGTITDVVTEQLPPETVYDVIQTVTPMIDTEVVHQAENITDVLVGMGIPFARRKELTLGDQPNPAVPQTPTQPTPPTPPTGGDNNGGNGGGQPTIVRAGANTGDESAGGGNGGGNGGNGGGAGPASVVRAGTTTGGSTTRSTVSTGTTGSQTGPASTGGAGGEAQPGTGASTETQTTSTQTGEAVPEPEPTIIRAPLGEQPEAAEQPITGEQPASQPETEATPEEQVGQLREDINELMNWPFDEEFEDAPGQTFRAAGNHLWWAAQAQSRLTELRSKNMISEEEYNNMFRQIDESKQAARQRVIEHYSQTMNIPEERLTTPTTKRVGGGEDLAEAMSPADQMIQGQYQILTRQRREAGLGQNAA